MSRKIKKISILLEGERVFIEATKFGKFRVPIMVSAYGRTKTSNKLMSAKELIEDENLKLCDPTITLENGDKIRVFQGGDPTSIVVQALGIIEKHDEEATQSNKITFNKPKPRKKVLIPQDDYDIFRDIMDWDSTDAD
jgi:hypothetical protein